MPESTFRREYLAERQLQTAIEMFLEGRDRFSVITLAGAASNILTQLVINKGKIPFIDYAREVHNSLIGFTPPREKYNKYINESFGINSSKHHSAEDDDFIELDEEEGAEYAITKALADYIEIKGQDQPFVKAFLTWAWKTKDGESIMERYAAFQKTKNARISK